MIIKDFLFKLKEDLKRVNLYPQPDFSFEGRVNYDAYWKKRRKNDDAKLSSWQKQRADFISSIITPGSSIMDIGCGDGAILKYIMDKTGAKGIGLDMSELELVKAKKIGIETYNIDLRDEAKLKALPRADYIIGLEILEHMAEPEHLVHLLASKTNKSLFFSFPNSGYYLHRVRFLFGKFPLQWIMHPGEHLRFWTVKDVKWWVSLLGYRMENLILYEGLPGLNKMLPSLFAQGTIINISKNEG